MPNILMGPIRENLVLDPLAVPHFDNQLYFTVLFAQGAVHKNTLESEL